MVASSRVRSRRIDAIGTPRTIGEFGLNPHLRQLHLIVTPDSQATDKEPFYVRLYVEDHALRMMSRVDQFRVVEAAVEHACANPIYPTGRSFEV